MSLIGLELNGTRVGAVTDRRGTGQCAGAVRVVVELERDSS